MIKSKITVLMPVFNSEQYLEKAIESILDQNYSNIEFLIINDGSTDQSEEIIKSYDDNRIRLVNNKKNMGLPCSLNKGMKIAETKYLARMDSDDISKPNRLSEQFSFMEKNTECGIVGTWAKKIYEKNNLRRIVEKNIMKRPTKFSDIKANLLFGNPLIHPSVMMNLKKMKKHNLFYNEKFDTSQDKELWKRCIKHFKIKNIPKPLVKYRVHEKSNRKLNPKNHEKNKIKIYKKTLSNLDLNLNLSTFYINEKKSKDLINRIENDLIKLYNFLLKHRDYEKDSLKREINKRWFKVCYKSANLGWWVYRKYKSFPLRRNILSRRRKIKFIVKCIFKKSSFTFL
ncbi:glycosyltransferase family 2 protein [Halarsenatibacter silvermanii]|uniref:Glycosyl transferase family 2 n=1 Tax=Halarsenatibacter silvermanii TaxID=321763 RepID=A0A1G9SAW9_9FIRM|nr:glycosyltransferase [Halarsenatibacter silvermanii]SDM32624.1 Glycosyl transferase family 2 [Halarsenatibacter silvermanii]